MDLKFNIDIEKIKELNNSKGDYLFKYLKSVQRNKTPIIMKGIKSADYWICDFYECSIPASHFTKVKIPAVTDRNPDNTELLVLLTEKLLSQFSEGTEYIFKENEVNIKQGLAKVRDSYKNTKQSLEEQLEDFTNVLSTDINKSKMSLTIDHSSSIIDLLKEIRNSPEASIFVSKDSLTLRNDSVFLRTKSDCEFSSSNEELYINMYLANKILSYLDFSEIVKIFVTDNNIVIVGYTEEEIVRNVSSIFEALTENPTDEDLASITPSEATSNVVNVDLQKFINEIENQKNLINTFISSKNLEAKLLKNKNGISLGFETNSDNADKTIVTINIGDVESTEILEKDFTEYSTVLPISMFKNLASNNQNLKIVFDNTEDTAVLFETGEYKILSGKLI